MKKNGGKKEKKGGRVRQQERLKRGTIKRIMWEEQPLSFASSGTQKHHDSKGRGKIQKKEEKGNLRAARSGGRQGSDAGFDSLKRETGPVGRKIKE